MNFVSFPQSFISIFLLNLDRRENGSKLNPSIRQVACLHGGCHRQSTFEYHFLKRGELVVIVLTSYPACGLS